MIVQTMNILWLSHSVMGNFQGNIKSRYNFSGGGTAQSSPD